MESIKQFFGYSAESPMLFTGMQFWVFFALVLVGMSLFYSRNRLRNVFLFIASLFFYYKAGGYFFSLLVFSTLVDYTVGLLMYQSKSASQRRIWLIVSLTVNLGVLAYFKYAYFFNDLVNQVLGTRLEVVNIFALWSNSIWGSSFTISEIILPVGISFFTFQTISYSFDVYRGKVEPVRNILDFGFYVSFFPQLVAGPIVRAAEFIPQLYTRYKLTVREFGHALFMILNGLIKKMVISDYISVNFVDRVFDNPIAYTGFENLMAVYGYAIQIYCDFSGYTDMAIGLALLLGFRLPLNFNSPYKAENITDFWRRWHISLSNWLRDYLYIPLGGNRGGKTRTYINLMITMLLGGLWHGANYRFILWGGIHGLGLAIHKLWSSISPFGRKNPRWLRPFMIILTFHFTCFAWLFFRAGTLDIVWVMLDRVMNFQRLDLLPGILVGYSKVFSLMIVAYLIHWLPAGFKEQYRGWFIRSSLTVKILLAVATLFLVMAFQTAGIQPFIYFQF